jgi:hypothetical protein
MISTLTRADTVDAVSDIKACMGRIFGNKQPARNRVYPDDNHVGAGTVKSRVQNIFLHPTPDTKDDHMIKMNTTYLPATLLLDAIGFEKRVKNRIEEYLTSNHIVSLSILQLMDLFLPQYQEPIREYSYWYDFKIPIMDQPQFGTYLFDSALLSITEAPMCKEARVEWALRLYPLMLLELKDRPTNIRRAELEARQAKRNNPLQL